MLQASSAPYQMPCPRPCGAVHAFRGSAVDVDIYHRLIGVVTLQGFRRSLEVFTFGENGKAVREAVNPVREAVNLLWGEELGGIFWEVRYLCRPRVLTCYWVLGLVQGDAADKPGDGVGTRPLGCTGGADKDVVGGDVEAICKHVAGDRRHFYSVSVAARDDGDDLRVRLRIPEEELCVGVVAEEGRDQDTSSYFPGSLLAVSKTLRLQQSYLAHGSSFLSTAWCTPSVWLIEL
ncbi:hypothetical protein B0H17DRAFT_1123868 [Mycena rosella]|uniref:Uncharacterized protein n=1 Tax=Mycena rosella TaxID=1033263 RepID=A0AAD7H2K9_MYCRO|nr:hypothetical protein B0H17DRAFT_1123868 [Mycena rosella]